MYGGLFYYFLCNQHKHLVTNAFSTLYSILCNQHMNLVPNLLLSYLHFLKFRWDLNQDFKDSWRRASSPTQGIRKLQICNWCLRSNRVFHVTKPFFLFNWIPSGRIIIMHSPLLTRARALDVSISVVDKYAIRLTFITVGKVETRTVHLILFTVLWRP